MKQNKLKRINLKSTLKLLPKYKILGVNVGNYLCVSFFSEGWYSQTFFGVCTSTYHISNSNCKIQLYNAKQRLSLIINLNLNIYKSIIKFI